MNDKAQARLGEGFALRRSHDTEGAHAAIAEAATLAPDNARTALALAHISHETWRPAAELFSRAQALDPGNVAIARGTALALSAEGKRSDAEALLTAVLARHPQWIDGHKTLATIRATGGTDAFDASFAEAAEICPDDEALHKAWFHALAGARRWDAARNVLANIEAHFGATRAARLARAFLASESDEASTNPHIFDLLTDIDDPGLDLARVRFWLRTGDPVKASRVAEARVGGSAARMFWPYLSLAWRLTNDPRAIWFGDDQAPIVTSDLLISPDEMERLAAILRRLLVLHAPYHEQSVRGGVQTDRHLFFNPDPAIQHVRTLFATAVADYVAALPAPVAHHPLLGLKRDRDVRFAGSWSVLLRGAGFHAPHTHQMGWISSAFYLSVPKAEGTQGWLAFGCPPPELGRALSATAEIAPSPGRLVLFPATAWHSTLPFNAGERLTIAFDVAVPD